VGAEGLDKVGDFRVPLLPPGNYEIEMSVDQGKCEGFWRTGALIYDAAHSEQSRRAERLRVILPSSLWHKS
jgi:hypothetical protein